MKAGSVTAKFRPKAVQASHFRWPFLTAHLTPSAPSAVPGIEITVACSSERWETSALQTTSAMTSAPSEKGLMPNPDLMPTDDTARPFVAGASFQPREHGGATWPMSPSQLFRQTLLGGFGAKKEAGPLVFGQIDSRSALAAACRRSLTSASSRAARSMRSCWTSVRSCWLLARSCWRSARSRTSLSWLAISCTVRVRSASCPATLAMSCSAVTPSYPILWGETRRGGLVAAPPPLLLLGGFGGITGEREPLRLRHNVQLVSLEAWQERPEN